MSVKHRTIVRLGTALAAFAMLMPAIGSYANAAYAANPLTAIERYNAAQQQARPDAITSIVNVTPSNMAGQGWVFYDDNGQGGGGGSMMTGPAAPPVGSGSANLYETASNAGWILGNYDGTYGAVKLANITTLRYSSYGNSNVQAPSLWFDVDQDVTDGVTSYQGRMTYEPYINGTYPVPGTWQTWDTLNSGNGTWWFSNTSPAFTSCRQSTPCPISQILANWPNIGVLTGAYHGIGFKVGSGWTAPFNGNVDKLEVVNTGTNPHNVTYNFDPDPIANAYGHLDPQASTGSGYEAYATEAWALANTRLNLDLKINSGDPNNKVTVAQNYVGFDSSRLQVVDAVSPACSPSASTTVNGDNSTFSTELQNEVCNGPGDCAFGSTVPEGSLAYASGRAYNLAGASGDFRVAQVGLCTTAALGDAAIGWQFDAPNNRDSYIEDELFNRVSSNAAYRGYTVHVVAPQLVGHVTYQGITQPGAANVQPITITVKSGTTELNQSATTDASGFFTVSLGTLTPGTYDWRVKGSRSLSNSGTFSLGATSVFTRISVDNVYTNGDAACATGCLRGGDGNNDNRDNASDFNVLRATYGKSVGQPGYDARADFDNNDTVGASDFNILRSNFGTSGTPALRPGGAK